MHHFFVEMCVSCLKRDVPLFESMEENGYKKVKNSTIIRNLFRKDFSEEFHNWKLCENCSILLKGAVILENAILSSQLIYSKYMKMFNAHNRRSSNKFSTLYVRIQDNRTKCATLKEATECATDLNESGCAKTEMVSDVKTFDEDVIDSKDFKIEIDEMSFENKLNDFCCETETINDKIKADNESMLESSLSVTMHEHKVDQLSKEAQKNECTGSSGFQFVSVGTEMNAVEEYAAESGLEAANSYCQNKSLTINTDNRKLTYLRAYSDEKPFKCVFCTKTFSDKSDYDKHSRIHTGEKPYKCGFCEKAFLQKSHYVLHRRIHTGEKPHKCDLCGKEFKRKSYYDRHKQIHTGVKPYKCELCEKAFSFKHSCVRHRLTHTGEKPYKCELCEKTFTRKSRCVEHTRIHTGEKPYKCDLCEKAYRFRENHINHRRFHTGEKPYKCDVCAKAFRQQAHRDVHRMIHTGVKPFKCDLCEKVFGRKSVCVEHTRIHTGEKPYKCDFCASAFSRKSYYDSHKRIHTGEKRYKCELCGTVFSHQPS